MNNVIVYPGFGGLTTAPEVNALIKKYGNPPGENLLMPYHEIETLIDTNKDTNRFRSVMTAWRKKLQRDYNILLQAVPNEGYKVMMPSERIDYGIRQSSGAIRKIKKVVGVVSSTDRARLSEQERRLADFEISKGQRLIQAQHEEQRRFMQEQKTKKLLKGGITNEAV